MKVNLRVINDLYILFFIVYLYLFAGFSQYFFGVSYTVITVISVFSFIFWYIIKPKSMIKKEYIPFVVISLALLVYIFIISFFNDIGFVRPIIYSQFFLVPIAVLFLLYSNDDRTLRFIRIKTLKKYLLYLALLQTPILLIQRNFFDILIKFNNSGKYLASVDFDFGTFPLKNDHSLGFFLVVNLLYIWSFKVLKNRTQQIIASLILILNLLLTNSNTSIIFAIGAIVYLIMRNKELKLSLSVKKILLVIGIAILLFITLEYFEPKFYYDLKYKLFNKLNLEDSVHWYKQGLARREQIVLVLISEGVNYIGNGAYAYFDIVTGQFNKTFRHFSQLIWTYYDLGIIGLTMFSVYVVSIHKVLKDRNANYNIYLTFGLLLYSFFTIMTFDLSFMLTYFIYKRKDD